MKPRQSFRRILPAAALAPVTLVAALALAVGSARATAATYMWTKATGTFSWNDTANWNPNTIIPYRPSDLRL